MVRRGEYLERAVVVPGGPSPIEGLFHRGTRAPALLVAPPHPSAGSMESPVVAEIAWAVTRAGHATLRFSYRGAGASGGRFEGTPGALSDARIAAVHLAATVGEGALAAVGVGFGAAIAARLALEHPLDALILVAPAPDELPPGLEAIDAEILIVAAERERSDRLEALSSLAVRIGRLAVIPSADPAFVDGLVALGRAVADALPVPRLRP